MGYLDIVNITSLFPLSKAWFAEVLRFPLCRFENFKNASELKPVNVNARQEKLAIPLSLVTGHGARITFSPTAQRHKRRPLHSVLDMPSRIMQLLVYSLPPCLQR